MAKNKITTSQGNVQFTNAKGRTINMHPMHCYAVYENDTVSFLFIYMKEYSGQAFFASQYGDLEVNGESYDNMDDLKDAINYAFAKAGAQARTEIVDELPEDPFTNTIYLLPKEHGEGYDEYIWNEDEGWQLIGDTDIEFERYLKIDDFNPYSAETKEYIDAVSGNTVQNALDIVSLSGAIDTEISARTDADAALSGAIDTVSSALTAESQRAISAETQLQTNINTVNSRVDAEQIARANADNVISGAVDTVVSDLASEVSRATAKENEIDSKVDGEISNREAADTAISGAVDTLSANLSLEVQRAQNAESALNTKVNAISGAVDTMGDEAIVDAAYVSSSTTIDFYNADGDVVAQVDATDFIKDGMIEDVRIENGYLIIDFNTASGKQDISIPLTDIFNPDNYYDKDAIDGIVSGLNEDISEKLAISDFNTYSAATDAVIASKFDASGITAYSTSQEVTAEIEAATSGKVDTTAFTAYSASVETALGNKADLSALTEDEKVLGESLNDLNTRLSAVTSTVGTIQTTIPLINGRIDAVTGDVATLSSNTLTSGDVQTQIDSSISGKVDTTAFTAYSASVETALSGKQDTLIAGDNITISGNVISASGGGGKAIEAGRGISITTGETADTISCTLSGGTLINIANNKINCQAPIRYGTGANSVIVGVSTSTNKASGMGSIANGGDENTASGQYSFAEGYGTQATKDSSHSEGWFTQASGNYSHAEGNHTKATNESEHTSGKYNVSSSASTTFGDSGNTLFSVGNGTADNARHNAFEIRQNGDIYLNDGTNDVKLQDTITATAANTAALGGLKLQSISQSDYDDLVSGGTVDASTLYIIND